MTPLDKTLKRALSIKGVDYVVTLSPETLKLTRKGRRLGMELKWADLTSGETALAVALHASVGQFNSPEDSEHSKESQSKGAGSDAKSAPRNRRASRGSSSGGRS
jgi:hypothetical protein